MLEKITNLIDQEDVDFLVVKGNQQFMQLLNKSIAENIPLQNYRLIDSRYRLTPHGVSNQVVVFSYKETKEVMIMFYEELSIPVFKCYKNVS